MTSADFSDSTVKQIVGAATSVNSITAITPLEQDKDTTAAYIAVDATGTSEYGNQVAVYKLEATPPEDDSYPMRMQLSQVWVKYGVRAKKVAFDRD